MTDPLAFLDVEEKKDPLAFLDSGGGDPLAFLDNAPPPVQQPVPQKDDQVSGDFMRGLRSGVTGMKQIGTGAAGAVMDIFGQDEAARRFYNKSLEHGQVAAQQSAGSPTSFSDDVEDLGSFIDWAQFTTGNLMPSLATTVAGGGAGALAARMAAKKLASKGALAGVFGTAGGMGTGEIASEQAELVNDPESGVEEYRPGLSLAGGVASGAVNIAPVYGAFKAIGWSKPFRNKVMSRLADRSKVEKIAAYGTMGLVAEGATELMDEAIILGARDVIQEDFEALGPEGRKRLVDALAAGGLMGLMTGGGTGLLVPKTKTAYEGDFNKEDVEAMAAEDYYQQNVKPAKDQQEAMDALIRDKNLAKEGEQHVADIVKEGEQDPLMQMIDEQIAQEKEMEQAAKEVREETAAEEAARVTEEEEAAQNLEAAAALKALEEMPLDQASDTNATGKADPEPNERVRNQEDVATDEQLVEKFEAEKDEWDLLIEEQDKIKNEIVQGGRDFENLEPTAAEIAEIDRRADLQEKAQRVDAVRAERDREVLDRTNRENKFVEHMIKQRPYMEELGRMGGVVAKSKLKSKSVSPFETRKEKDFDGKPQYWYEISTGDTHEAIMTSYRGRLFRDKKRKWGFQVFAPNNPTMESEQWNWPTKRDAEVALLSELLPKNDEKLLEMGLDVNWINETLNTISHNPARQTPKPPVTKADLAPAVMPKEEIQQDTQDLKPTDPEPAPEPPPTLPNDEIASESQFKASNYTDEADVTLSEQYRNYIAKNPELADMFGPMLRKHGRTFRLWWGMSKLEDAGKLSDKLQNYYTLAENYIESIQELDAQGATLNGLLEQNGESENVNSLWKEVVSALAPTKRASLVEPSIGPEIAVRRQQIEEMLHALPHPKNVPFKVKDLAAAEEKGLKGSFAMYGTGQGEVTLIAENLRDQSDAFKTYVHEYVGHAGLRNLIGESGVSSNEFHQTMKKSFPQEWKNREKLYGSDPAVIADEVFAKVAEDYVQGYESTRGFTVAKPTRQQFQFIQKIREWLTKLFNRTPIHDKLRQGLKLSEGDIYLAVRKAADTIQAQNKVRAVSEANRYSKNVEKGMPSSEGEVTSSMQRTAGAFKRNFWGLFATEEQIARLNANAVPAAQGYVDEETTAFATKHRVLSDGNLLAATWNKSEELTKATFNAFLEILAGNTDRAFWAEPDKNNATRLENLLVKHGLHKIKTKHKEKDGSVVELSGVDFFYAMDDYLNKTNQEMMYGSQYKTIRGGAFGKTHVDTEAFLENWNQRSLKEKRTFVDSLRAQVNSLERPTDEDKAELAAYTELLHNDNGWEKQATHFYFPYKRFGRYSLTVVAEQDIGDPADEGNYIPKGWQLSFSQYETAGDMDAAAKEISKQFQGTKVKIKKNKMTDKEYIHMDLPEAVMRKIEDESGLNPEQLASLRQIQREISPSRSFLRHLQKRNNIHGFTQDANRAFASYAMSASQQIMSFRHGFNMADQLDKIMKSPLQQVEQDGTVKTVDQQHRDWLYQYYSERFKKQTQPTNDWEILRAASFYWYLTNLKSSVVNLYHVPMVLLPYASAHLGPTTAFKHVTGATKDITAELTVTKKGKHLSNLEVEFLDRAMDRGVITDTFVNNLLHFQTKSRALQETAGRGIYRKLSVADNVLTWAFRNTEEYGRRIAVVAFTRMLHEKNPNLSRDDLWKMVEKETMTSMFRYSSWNRPKFMQGKVGNLFIFRQYMQGLLALMAGYGGKKAAATIVMTHMAAAGLMGIPGIEDIEGLWSMTMRQFRKFMGLPFEHHDMNMSVREHFQSLAGENMQLMSDYPEVFMHGMASKYGLGPAHLLNFVGLPVPNVDVSSSIGMGAVIPGLNEATTYSNNSASKGMRLAESVLGPAGGIAFSMYRGLESNDPDTWKRIEGMLPPIIRNKSAMARRITRGEETLPGGGTMREYDFTDLEDVMSVMLKGAGFEESAIRENQRLRGYMNQLNQAYNSHRSGLMRNYALGIYYKDKRRQKAAMTDIHTFNKNLATDMKHLSITYDSLSKSVTGHIRRIETKQAGLPHQKGWHRHAISVKELYPQAAQK